MNGVAAGSQFEKELNNIIDENTDLKIENKRLKKLVSGLRAKLSSMNSKANTRKQPVSYQTGNYMKPTK